MNNLAFRDGSFGFRSSAGLVVIRCLRGLFLAPAIFLATSQNGSAVPPSQYGFYTLTPCRIVDTRNAAGPYGGPALSANSDRSFIAWGRCGIPSSADAITLNVTVTGATSGGDFRIYPGGTPLGMASSINYAAGRTRANNGTYRLGSAGDLAVHVDQASGSAHLILDVSGYFETADPPPPPPTGSPFSRWYLASGDDSGKAVVIDGGGNALVAGQYQGTADFGGGLVTSYTNPGSGPTMDAFVAKYSASGVPVWSRGFGGNASDSASGVAVDSGGDVVVTGYQGSSQVDYGAGTLGTRGSNDIFLAKYSSATGGHVWSKTVGGTGPDWGRSVAMDSGGNVFVTGYMSVSSSGVDFGGGALFSAGGADAFLVKYSSGGAHVWSKRFGGSGTDMGTGVAVDASGNVVVVGSFEGTIDLGGGSLTSAGGRDLFVAKFLPTGQYLWSKRFGGTSTEDVRGVAVDGAGDVLLTGQFLGTINFGGPTLTSAGYEDIFLAKLSATGGHVWSQRLGSSSAPDAGYGVAVDGAGNVAITGFFAGSVDFGGGAIMAQVYDIFVAKYSSAGGYISARRYGDPAGLYDSQYGDAIAMSSSGTVFITGHFVGTLNFGAAGQATSTFAGGNDGYLASVGP